MGQLMTTNNITLTPPATRMSPPDDLRVTARTMGTPNCFEVNVSNLSRSGMLLEWDSQKFRLPFRENTLIELEVKTQFKGLPRKINCLAKVVRRNTRGQTMHYGIRMIHHDEQEHLNWLSMIASIEKNSQQVP
jgi:hypothetical protein